MEQRAIYFYTEACNLAICSDKVMSSIIPKMEPTTPQQPTTAINPPYTAQYPSRVGAPTFA